MLWLLIKADYFCLQTQRSAASTSRGLCSTRGATAFPGPPAARPVPSPSLAPVPKGSLPFPKRFVSSEITCKRGKGEKRAQEGKNQAPMGAWPRQHMQKGRLLGTRSEKQQGIEKQKWGMWKRQTKPGVAQQVQFKIREVPK